MSTQAQPSSTPQTAAGFAPAGLVDRTVNHLLERIDRAQVEPWPFQHFYVEGMLPDDVYRQVLANLPEKSSYLPFNIKRWKNDKGESTRDRLCLTEGELDRIDEARRPFWTSLVEALGSDAFRRAVYEKLKGDIAIRLGCAEDAVLDQPGYPAIMLVRDYQDYRIKPHPDGQPRVVTMQFYLPHDGNPDNLGTSLYVKQSLALQLVGRKYKEIKRFPFRPNSGYAFAVNDCGARQSYHGRELITASSTIRDSILISWLSRDVTVGQKHKM